MKEREVGLDGVTLNYKLSNLPPPSILQASTRPGEVGTQRCRDCLIRRACSTAKSIQQIRGLSSGTKKAGLSPETPQASNQEAGEDMGPGH